MDFSVRSNNPWFDITSHSYLWLWNDFYFFPPTNDDHFRGGSYPVLTIDLQFLVFFSLYILYKMTLFCLLMYDSSMDLLFPLTRWSVKRKGDRFLCPTNDLQFSFFYSCRSNVCSWVWLFCNSSLPLPRWSVKQKEDLFLCPPNDLQFSFFYPCRSNVCSWVWLFCNSSLPLTRWSVKRKEDRFL